MATTYSTTGGNLQTPRDFVQAGWDWFKSLGNEWVLESKQELDNLDSFVITPITFDPSVTPLDVTFSQFVAPPVPEVPDLGEIDVTIPDAPATVPVSVPALGDAPEEPDFSGMTYAMPTAPNEPMPVLTDDVNPVLDPIVVPDAPVYDLPVAPTLYELNLPDAPDVVIPDFIGTPPQVDAIEVPDAHLDWQEQVYSSGLLDSIKSRLQDIITGSGLGLPPEIEQALFDRGRQRADILARKRVQETAEELGSRGLYEGGPFIGAKLDEAREAGRAEAAGHNRDITINATQMQVESVRFALTQGIALEGVLIQQNGSLNDRALQAAKIGSDIAVAVVNVRIALATLDLETFKVDLEAYKAQIEGKLAQVQLYEAEIRGQQAIGSLNESLVRAYTAKFQGLQAMVDIYRANVEAAKAKGDLNSQKIEQAKNLVQAYAAKVDGWKGLQDAYKSQVDGALGTIRYYEVLGGVYGQRVTAYRTKGEAYFQQGQFQLDQQRLGFQGYQAQLDGIRTKVTADAATIDAKARTFAARANMYQAQGQMASAEAASIDRNAELRIEAARFMSDAQTKNLDLLISQNNAIASLYVEQLKTRAQVLSQLTSATFSGVNFGASYSGSLGYSYGTSSSYGYSGEATDYDGPAVFM